jgi:AcrR family transcriptional regulator
LTRVPRAEQKIRTRSRLVEAAGRLFLSHGIDGVSLDAVAEAAGFSKGAVYANFTGKEDLLLAVWREHFAAKRLRLADAVTGADEATAVLRAIHGAMATFFAAGPWALLQAEVRRRSADWPRLADELAALEAEELTEMNALVAGFLQRFAAPPGPDPAEMTQTLAALFDGLVLRAAVAPVDPERLADRFMSVVVALSGLDRPAAGAPR